MPFGIQSAQDIFQKRMHQNFGDLARVETDINDILVWETNEEEHNKRLKVVLQQCKEIDPRLNRENCQFGMPQFTYLGHTINAQGISPDRERVKAICEMPPSQDKKGVKRLLGLNYMAKFIPDLSTLTQPIREILKKNMQFIWEWEQQEALNRVTERLSVAPVLAFYDARKTSTISCDASQTGLGAVLLQDHKPVAYASRSMSVPKTRYAQIEKELLAVVFSLGKFHQYIYGTHVNIESDHKPLEIITRKQLCQAPPRLQRMLLRLQRYDYTLRYTPGKDMVIADTLSRAYIPHTPSDDLEEELDCAVHMVLEKSSATDKGLQNVRKNTETDHTLQKLKGFIRTGWPDNRADLPEDIRA